MNNSPKIDMDERNNHSNGCIIGEISDIKHYMTEKIYEKLISAMIKDEYKDSHNNWITKKIAIYC